MKKTSFRTKSLGIYKDQNLSWFKHVNEVLLNKLSLQLVQVLLYNVTINSYYQIILRLLQPVGRSERVGRQITKTLIAPLGLLPSLFTVLVAVKKNGITPILERKKQKKQKTKLYTVST